MSRGAWYPYQRLMLNDDSVSAAAIVGFDGGVFDADGALKVSGDEVETLRRHFTRQTLTKKSDGVRLSERVYNFYKQESKEWAFGQLAVNPQGKVGDVKIIVHMSRRLILMATTTDGGDVNAAQKAIARVSAMLEPLGW